MGNVMFNTIIYCNSLEIFFYILRYTKILHFKKTEREIKNTKLKQQPIWQYGDESAKLLICCQVTMLINRC